jgi:hypothetical protein
MWYSNNNFLFIGWSLPLYILITQCYYYYYYYYYQLFFVITLSKERRRMGICEDEELLILIKKVTSLHCFYNFFRIAVLPLKPINKQTVTATFTTCFLTGHEQRLSKFTIR